MEMTAVTEQPPRDDELRRFLPWLDESTQPAPAPARPVAVEDPAERRRAEKLARALAHIRRQRHRLKRHTLISMTAVIIISGVITYFGSYNAHGLLVRHNTPSVGAWLLYPALEAALIVEIQIGGVLAEHKRRVAFWGTALRVVTAVAAITLCAAGPGELGDPWGAFYHSLGPVVQFFLAEFLAESRAEFKGAADSLVDKEEGREQAATTPARDRGQGLRKRSPKTASAGAQPVRKSSAETDEQDRSPDLETGTELVLTATEKRALATIQRKGSRVSKRTVIEEVRAAGGAIGTTRALAIAREWGPGSTGPELSIVEKKEA